MTDEWRDPTVEDIGKQMEIQDDRWKHETNPEGILIAVIIEGTLGPVAATTVDTKLTSQLPFKVR